MYDKQMLMKWHEEGEYRKVVKYAFAAPDGEFAYGGDVRGEREKENEEVALFIFTVVDIDMLHDGLLTDEDCEYAANFLYSEMKKRKS